MTRRFGSFYHSKVRQKKHMCDSIFCFVSLVLAICSGMAPTLLPIDAIVGRFVRMDVLQLAFVRPNQNNSALARAVREPVYFKSICTKVHTMRILGTTLSIVYVIDVKNHSDADRQPRSTLTFEDEDCKMGEEVAIAVLDAVGLHFEGNGAEKKTITEQTFFETAFTFCRPIASTYRTLGRQSIEPVVVTETKSQRYEVYASHHFSFASTLTEIVCFFTRSVQTTVYQINEHVGSSSTSSPSSSPSSPPPPPPSSSWGTRVRYATSWCS